MLNLDFGGPGLWFGLVALVVAMLVLAVVAGRREGRRAQPARRGEAGAWAAYATARRRLMTVSEERFEKVLRGALAEVGCGGWRVDSQVALTAVFEAKARPRGSGSERAGWLPPWCLDFVLTDEGGAIRGIVELNDPTHRRRDRRRRDANLEAGCRSLGVPLLFVAREGEEKLSRWLRRIR